MVCFIWCHAQRAERLGGARTRRETWGPPESQARLDADHSSSSNAAEGIGIVVEHLAREWVGSRAPYSEVIHSALNHVWIENPSHTGERSWQPFQDFHEPRKHVVPETMSEP